MQDFLLGGGQIKAVCSVLAVMPYTCVYNKFLGRGILAGGV